MIVTDKFSFVHMHKTGGQSLARIIGACMPESRQIGYHYPYSLLPEEYRDRPVVGMVRNPWDWYLSWFAFNTQPGIGNPLFYIVSDGCQADYRRTIANLVNLCSDTDEAGYLRNALIEILPETLEGNTGVGLTKDDIRGIEPSEEGYYSWQFRRMHGGLERDGLYIGRFENLQQEFLRIMGELQVDQTDALQQGFEHTPRINASKHSHYSRYYDDELRDLVARREKDLIDRFDYRFEAVESNEARIEFPSIQIGRRQDSFHKLDGKSGNFLLLKSDFDVEPLKRKLAKIPEKAWYQSGREEKYEVHKQTRALQLIYDADFRHYQPTVHPLHHEFRRELEPFTDFITRHYDGDGFIVRLVFARLDAHGAIPPHSDGLYSLLKCHRLHVPIVTNDKVGFWVGGQEINMREGEMWEINNATLHAVYNRSDLSRIHMIIDWVPTSTLRPEDKRPPRPSRATATGSSRIPDFNGRRVGRNESCPCGSGKKFKHCCGAAR